MRATCVDQTCVHGDGAPEQLEPVLTKAGVVAVPIDWRTVELVWHASRGYPAQPGYRDYHRRTRYDLRPWSTTGEPYRPAAARALAAEHARGFVAHCLERLDAYAADRGRPGLLCCAFDTELLGHWWYEGRTWLRLVFEEAQARGLDLVTVSEGARASAAGRAGASPLHLGGRQGPPHVDSPLVAEPALAARRAELRTVVAAARANRPAALERAARELLTLQASDWAFQVTSGLAGDYPLRRVAAHAAANDAAIAALTGTAPDPALRGLAPDLDLAPLTSP